jgi:hypothetical protein
VRNWDELELLDDEWDEELTNLVNCIGIQMSFSGRIDDGKIFDEFL